MTPGEVLMLLWCVGSWGILLKVGRMVCKRSLLVLFRFTFVPTDAVSFHRAHFGAGTGPIHLNNVDCSGSETKLINCSHNSYFRCYSGHLEDVGVRCQGRQILDLYNYGFLPTDCATLLLCSQFQWQLYLWRCSSGGRLQSV